MGVDGHGMFSALRSEHLPSQAYLPKEQLQLVFPDLPSQPIVVQHVSKKCKCVAGFYDSASRNVYEVDVLTDPSTWKLPRGSALYLPRITGSANVKTRGHECRDAMTKMLRYIPTDGAVNMRLQGMAPRPSMFARCCLRFSMGYPSLALQRFMTPILDKLMVTNGVLVGVHFRLGDVAMKSTLASKNSSYNKVTVQQD